MQVDWWTLGLQALNFLILVWLLWRFLYRPVKDVIEKRKALAEQAFTEAKAREEAAEAARQRFEDSRAGLAQERHEMLDRLHVEMEAERTRVLEEARGQAQQIQEEARAAVAKEREGVLAETRKEVAALAAALAATVLRDAGGDPDDALLDQLEAQLKGLPEAERARLAKDLDTDGARLTVVTAAPVPQDARTGWAERLDACLGHGGKIDFAVDPEILGGAEIRLPHAVFSFTWADHLRKAGERLLGDDSAS